MNASTNRREFLASIAALSAGSLSSTAALAQEAYPGKGPIKVIVPLPAGGGADVSVRLVAASMQNTLKQSIVVDNRPGGSFVVAMQAIAQAPADGYTLIQIYPGMLAAQASMKKFDILKSLTPISLMGSTPALLAVPASSPYKTVKDLVNAGVAKQGSLNYGSVGPGTIEHLWCSEFSKHNNMEAVHVPFKGMPDAATALINNEIQFLPLNMVLALQFVQKNMIRVLAVLDTQRHPAMPNVPTIKEAGYNEPPQVFWSGLAAPKGTPAAVIEKLREHISMAVTSDELKTKFQSMGITSLASPRSNPLSRWLSRSNAG